MEASTKTSTRKFVVEGEKFCTIKSSLLARERWEKDEEKEEESGVEFLWTNLAKVDFQRVFERNLIINHLRGSQHLSNKALLAYHVNTSSLSDHISMPLQWSAAYEDLVCLMARVTINSAYCIAQRLLLPFDHPDVMTINNSRHHIETLHNVLCALRMDTEWQSSSNVDAVVLATLVDQLMKVLKSSSTSPHPNKETMDTLSMIVQTFCDSKRGKYVSWGGIQDVWIVKPVGLSCGQQIACVHGLEGVLKAAQHLHYKCVVQKYIERPLLARRERKFDIRQWILVSNVDPLIIYGFSECYLRLSSKPFSLDTSNLSNATIHLCNHAIQKLTAGNETMASTTTPIHPCAITTGVFEGMSWKQASDNIDRVIGEELCDTMMSQEEFEYELGRGPLGKDAFDTIILPQIKTIAINVIDSVRDKLDRVGRGFEWLGLDLMVTGGSTVDENLAADVSPPEVLLLEVNVSPDISFSTPVTRRLVVPAVNDLLDLLLDEGVADDPISHHKIRRVRTRQPVEMKEENCRKLQWDLWHVGDTRGKRESLAFTRAKRDIQQLGATSDYAPRKEQNVHRVLEILKNDVSSKATSGRLPLCVNDDDDDEDEI